MVSQFRIMINQLGIVISQAGIEISSLQKARPPLRRGEVVLVAEPTSQLQHCCF
jgi:hypothetical protein